MWVAYGKQMEGHNFFYVIREAKDVQEAIQKVSDFLISEGNTDQHAFSLTSQLSVESFEGDVKSFYC